MVICELGWQIMPRPCVVGCLLAAHLTTRPAPSSFAKLCTFASFSAVRCNAASLYCFIAVSIHCCIATLLYYCIAALLLYC